MKYCIHIKRALFSFLWLVLSWKWGNIRKVTSYLLRPNHLRLIACCLAFWTGCCKIVIWLCGLVAKANDKDAFFLYDLDIACLYFEPLTRRLNKLNIIYYILLKYFHNDNILTLSHLVFFCTKKGNTWRYFQVLLLINIYK